MAKLQSKRKQKKDISAEKMEQALEGMKSKEKKYPYRVTVDFPEDIHAKMKELVKEEERTLRGYIVSLVKKDLKNR